MNTYSAFDIIGPAMIGPSSSHTAGAVRLGLLARGICGSATTFYPNILIELHGSFAATGEGHATDRGIVAGLLGLLPDDERLKDSLKLAQANATASASQSHQASMPSPVFAQIGNIFRLGLRIWAYFTTFSISKSK